MVQSPIQSKEQINKKGGIGVCVQVCVCGGVDQNLKKKGGVEVGQAIQGGLHKITGEGVGTPFSTMQVTDC